MGRDERKADSAYFVLAVWCSAAKAWRDLPLCHHSAQAAEAAAAERGIYRATYICEGRRLDLEPFALVGDN